MFASDAVEIFAGAGGPCDAAIDHKVMRTLGDIGVEVVHQHVQRSFGHPASGAEFRTLRRGVEKAIIEPLDMPVGMQAACRFRSAVPISVAEPRSMGQADKAAMNLGNRHLRLQRRKEAAGHS